MKTGAAKNIIYLTAFTTSIFLSAQIVAVQKIEELIIKDLVDCINNFDDTRSYTQFIDEIIKKVVENKAYLVEHFKQNHPTLTVDGFIAQLQAARKATNPLSAGAALKNYYELLPKHITFGMLMNGINRRMKADFKKN